MIVFNAAAIPVVIVVALVVAPLFYFFPGLEEGYEPLVIGLAAAGVGGLSDLLGLKGRLFWLPIWLVGLGITTWGLYEPWGWAGVGAGAGAAVAGLVGLVLWARHVEKKEWERAPAALARARDAWAAGDRPAAWKAMKDAFFVPVALDWTPEVCAHGRESIALLRDLAAASDQAEAAAARLRLDQLDTLLAEGLTSGPPKIEDKLTEWLKAFVEKAGAPPEGKGAD